jgi:hypothetical protein
MMDRHAMASAVEDQALSGGTNDKTFSPLQ